jgi:lactoylglutathione lyase
MRTLHVGLRVTDLERSVAFYTTLGYEVVGTVPETELGSLTMLKLPGDEFVAVELVHDTTRGRVEPGGLSHLVIQVEDVQATVAHLAERGVQADEPGSPDGSPDFWTAWVTDPDGYRIELVQWPDGHPEGMTGADLAAPAAEPPVARHPRNEGDLVAQHVTLHGTHRASTMPLLADAPVTGRSATWTFIHIRQVADGMLVEHWACRDVMGLLEQVRSP